MSCQLQNFLFFLKYGTQKVLNTNILLSQTHVKYHIVKEQLVVLGVS